MFKLFLDDVRDPPDETWMLARSYSEAVALVEQHGFPTCCAFDHDLGKAPILEDKTGLDFAHYLIELDLDTGTMPDDFTFSVHSANPVGRDDIVHLLERYLRFRDDDGA